MPDPDTSGLKPMHVPLFCSITRFLGSSNYVFDSSEYETVLTYIINSLNLWRYIATPLFYFRFPKYFAKEMFRLLSHQYCC